MGDAALRRQLKIKTGACKRLFKDYTSYETEAREQETRIERMVAQPGADEYAVKKQREVLGETRAMIADSKARLEASRADLRDFLSSLGTLGNSVGPEPDDARAILDATSSLFPQQASS